MKLILLGLNEINFEYVSFYIRNGYLKNFARVLEKHGYHETISEDKYEDIEPWIQWVTINTGKTLKEHGVYRLGDILGSKNKQIFEQLEEKGLKVGAVSPMNTENRLTTPAFFAPDPWTKTKTSGPPVLHWLVKAVSEAVNKNAQLAMSNRTKLSLIVGLLYFSKFSSIKYYLKYILGSRKKSWYRPFILDRLLTDVFLSLWKKNLPDFSCLFLNAGAHIQHHYLFNSKAYTGTANNPVWYVDKNDDPVFEIYNMYDQILGELLTVCQQSRILIATGLHQDPHERVTYYYRLRNHDEFLRKAGIRFDSVTPLMSRDFTINFSSESDAITGENILKDICDENGDRLFYVDNRGCNLFVMLTYPNQIDREFKLFISSKEIPDFYNDVAFVAIKNGQHNNIGYFIDNGESKTGTPSRIPLKELHSRIYEICVN